MSNARNSINRKKLILTREEAKDISSEGLDDRNMGKRKGYRWSKRLLELYPTQIYFKIFL